MKPGVYDNIPNDEYHGGPGISKSGLDLIHRSPMHYHAVVTAANDNRQPTPAQAIGTAAHALILEPAEFTKQYCLGLRRQDVPAAIDDREELVAMVAKLNEGRLPKLSTSGSKAELVERIREAKPEHQELDVTQLDAMKGADLKAILDGLNQARHGLLPTSGSRHDLAAILRANGVEVTLWSDVQAEWLANNGTRSVLTQEQWDMLHGMREAVMAHPAASALLSKLPGKAELSVYWSDAVTGSLCRCRPDYWREDDLLVDLKTTEDASPEGFSKSIANYRYDVQAAYYLDGVNQATGRKPRQFVFIAVEKKPPYAVGVYTLDAETLMLGRAQYQADLRTYAECVANDNWPGYGDKIQKISMPGWHANKNQHLLDNN
jgi:exodeoxyribonuclease VIII